MRGLARYRDCTEPIWLHRDQDHRETHRRHDERDHAQDVFHISSTLFRSAPRWRLSIAASPDYLAATGVFVLLKFGGRFSRKAESASLASAEVTRTMNSSLSLFIACLSWPIEACLRSRLLASNAPLGFAASFCAVAVAVASRSALGTTRVTRPSSAARGAVKGSPSKYNSAARRWPTRAGIEKLDPNSGTSARLMNGNWNLALSPA